MKMPNIKMISIIIPTYNREKTIAKSIESVLNQTYPYFELIIVDDCSTDATGDIVKGINDTRVRYLCNETNVGAAAARNIGVNHSKYDLIAFQDSDDIWLAEKLEKQIDFYKNNPECALIYCALMYHKGDEIFKIPDYNRDTYELLLAGNAISTQTMLIKKDTFYTVDGFNDKLRALEDWDLAIRVSEKYKIGYVDECLVDVYFSDNSVNHHNKNLIDAQIHILSNNIQKVEDKSCFRTSILYLMKSLIKGFSSEEILFYQRKIVPCLIKDENDFQLIMDEIRRSIKFEDNYNLLTAILKHLDSVKYFDELFHSMNIKHVAIYGAGKVGKILGSIITKTFVDLDYYIDRNEIFTDSIKVISKKNITSKTELIIISLPSSYKQIKESLELVSKAKIVFLEDIL